MIEVQNASSAKKKDYGSIRVERENLVLDNQIYTGHHH
jgi:hypothetical protein